MLLGVSSVLPGIHRPLFADEQNDFVVIVHQSNPYSEITIEELSNIFLKKISRWKHSDELIYPLDLLEDAPIRIVFSKVVHGRKVSSIKAYWQRQIFSGREIPPPEKETERDILEFISQKTGAIGYVSASTELDEYDVKPITIIDIEE
jgi:ABC-type phosphate transport system substrate-binding protein